MRKKTFGNTLEKIQGLDVKSLEKPETSKLEEIKIHRLVPGKSQPRKRFDALSLQELSESIRAHGVLQPIIARKVPESNELQIVAGERRWRAANMAGLSRVPVIQLEMDDKAATAVGLIENIQREDLNVIDKAEGFLKLKEKFKLTQEDVAKVVGVSRESVANILRLLSLETPVREKVRDGLLDMGHARAILALQGEAQYEIAEKVIEQNLSVRKTETLVRDYLNPKPEKTTPSEKTIEKNKRWGQALGDALSTKVSVTLNDDGEGKIVIAVNDSQEVEWLLQQIKSK